MPDFIHRSLVTGHSNRYLLRICTSRLGRQMGSHIACRSTQTLPQVSSLVLNFFLANLSSDTTALLEWISADNTQIANWNTTTGTNYVYHEVFLASQSQYTELSPQGMAQWGSLYFATTQVRIPSVLMSHTRMNNLTRECTGDRRTRRQLTGPEWTPYPDRSSTLTAPWTESST